MTNTELEFHALITEREGMVALNQQRVACGNSLAFTNDAFDALAEKIRALKTAELGASPNNARDAIVALEKRVAALERLCAASRLSLNVPLGGAPMAP